MDQCPQLCGNSVLLFLLFCFCSVQDPRGPALVLPCRIRRQRVLDSHVTLSLIEVLGITKKEFHDTIVDPVKRKRQQSDEEEERPVKAKTNAITMARDEVDEDMVDSHYTRPHWARATTETPMKIGEKKETVVALINHGSEINCQDSNSWHDDVII